MQLLQAYQMFVFFFFFFFFFFDFSNIVLDVNIILW